MNITFIGLGKLGLPLACILAKTNKVLCLDKNEYVLDKLSNNETPFFEPNLDNLWRENKHNILGYTDSYRKAVTLTDAAVILVNTQLGDDGYSSAFVESALSDIAINLKNIDKDYFNIILSSTVLPGTIVDNLIPLVERISGKTFGKDFGFSFVPDFVKLGSVVWDFKNPEFFLIAANNDRDHRTTEEVFRGIHDNDPPHYRLTLEEAEIAKVALNAYIVNKITFANFLGRLCNGINNVDVHNITNVIGNDKRISPFFFSSGTPYGGTCFPRDTWAFIKFAKDRKHVATNLLFAEEVNQLVYDYIFNEIKGFDKVGILGVSFKPSTPVTIGSPSADLIGDLKAQGKTVYAHDDLDETYENLGMDVVKCDTQQACVDASEVVVLMHPNKNYKYLDYGDKKVVDLWGLL